MPLSLWRDREPVPTDTQLAERYDDLVVGAGLTGLTTALLLARAGRSVAVIEARDVGAAATGNTTGKVSLLQGTRLSQILSRQSERVGRAYVEANREGQAWLLRFCEEHDVAYQVRDAVTCAADDREVSSAREELEAARSLGLDVRWSDDLAVPFDHRGGVVLADQAQVDSMDVLAALVREVRREGGTVVCGVRVVGADPGATSVTLDDGRTVHAESIVLATGTPVLDRGLYFAKLSPERSYALAFRHPDPPALMLLTAGSSARSVRDAPSPDGRLLLVGGEGHVVGRGGTTSVRLDRLRAWTERWFPGAEETHAWSAQDYRSHDGLPFIGAMPRGRGRIQVATGFGKWGMTNGVAAALAIAQEAHGHRASWQRTLTSRITRPSGALELARFNATVGVHLAGDLARAELVGLPDELEEGQGVVGRHRGLPAGRSLVGGQPCSVVALCTHLGGTLRWNDAEQSWDCPLHGSRFAPDGEVLEGPATQPLKPLP